MGMTEQEAKEWFECIVYEQAPKTQKAMLLGIKALEKQIPKKPIPYKPWEGKCPACSVVFVNRLTSYCGNCGQKLDWGNEDAE